METIETQGNSIELATKAAADKLGVPQERIKVTVLDEAKGLFGKATVRIKAEVISEEALAKAPKREPRVSAAKAETPKAAPEPETIEKKPIRKARSKVAEAKPAPSDGDAEETRADVVATEADAKAAQTIVQDILRLAELEGTVQTGALNGRYVNLELDGKDVAYLVGKHGEVLNAFQYLVNVMLSRKQGNGVRVTLDGNHYRQRREEALSKLAMQIADQVRDRGEEAVLDALPAFERRVVHKALQEFAGIQTYSEGEEPNRRVVIAPG